MALEPLKDAAGLDRQNELGVRLEREVLDGRGDRVRAGAEARTGVEMEALCGVSAGLLAVYDMCKAADREMEIFGVRLLAKEGGSSGQWVRTPDVATEK